MADDIELLQDPGDANRVKCNFCNDSQIPAEDTFGDGDARICSGCVRELSADHAERLQRPREAGEDSRTCSFCGNDQDFTEGIIVAPEKYLCTDCLRGFAEQVASRSTA